MPFSFIPNCIRIITILSPPCCGVANAGNDWIFALFGLAIRGKGSSFETRNWRTGKANRHLFSEFMELGALRYKGDMKAYWVKAWKEVFENKEYKYVYEFDLNNFFNEVDLRKIVFEMANTLSYPKEVVNMFRQLNQSVVKLGKEDLLTEPERLILIDSKGGPNVNHKNKPGKSWKELHPEIPQELRIELMRRDMEDLDKVSIEWILLHYVIIYKKYQELQYIFFESINPNFT